MRKILVLRGGALGDFIVTLPALALLRGRWPRARIELAGNATAAALAVKRGLLDAAHSQHEARWSALFRDAPLPSAFAAWLAEFDLVVNYWPDSDGVLAKHFPLRARQTFLSAPAMPTQAPAAAHYCAPLLALDLETREYWYPLAPVVPRGDAGAIPPLPRRATNGPIAIHPGSGSPRKNWPAERWIELIHRLHTPILLILGEAEERWSPMSSSGFPFHVRILQNASLETLVTELSACRLFLGHDSGISHLAAACGIPSVLLFGPTDPIIWSPPAPHVRVLQRGPDLSALSVEDVLAASAEAPSTKIQAPERLQF